MLDKTVLPTIPKYRIPSRLNDFQRRMYEHLVEYKWNNLKVREPGRYEHPKKKGTFIEYDLMFPEALKDQFHPLYRSIVEMFRNPRDPRYSFKVHEMAVHMASSQIACANLFLPLMIRPQIAAKVLSTVKKDMDEIATERLDSGFAIEFWNDFDVLPMPKKGILNDHTPFAGTDADIAIAYRDIDGVLCLWLIEHKLTEPEFTTCGGYKSGNNTNKERCNHAANVVINPDECHYQSSCRYAYWDIALANRDVFRLDSLGDEPCPFKGGMNQLWRNLLMATAIEKSADWPYRRVYFSVVHHPANKFLNQSMMAFRALLGSKADRFTSFTSAEVLNHARHIDDSGIKDWAKWYERLYMIDSEQTESQQDDRKVPIP